MWSDPTLADWAKACSGILVGDDCVIDVVSTDTRNLNQGDVYVALKGEYFDGHNYVATAVAKGAKAIVVQEKMAIDLPQLVVPDTKTALGWLAGILRQRFKGQVIALTGSVGKTSTRAMLKHILAKQPGLLATSGNFNNDIGVPKTWFELNDRHQRVLLEMGASAQKEIEWLTEFSKPHISLLLNAGQAHIEGFGGIEGVRKGKGEIITGTHMEGGVVLNQDDHAFGQWLKLAGDRKVISFGKHTDADVCLLDYEATHEGSRFTLSMPDGDISVQWPIFGKHMAINAAAAAATAWLAGVSPLDIAEGLGEMQPEPGRMEPLASLHGGALIHDAYNANPTSFEAAIDVLSTFSGQSMLIAGDMAELGEDSKKLHHEIGVYARGKITSLWTVGQDARYMSEAFGGHHFETLEDLLAVLPAKLESDTAVLVKGSRSAGMERVIDALKRTA